MSSAATQIDACELLLSLKEKLKSPVDRGQFHALPFLDEYLKQKKRNLSDDTLNNLYYYVIPCLHDLELMTETPAAEIDFTDTEAAISFYRQYCKKAEIEVSPPSAETRKHLTAIIEARGASNQKSLSTTTQTHDAPKPSTNNALKIAIGVGLAVGAGVATLALVGLAVAAFVGALVASVPLLLGAAAVGAVATGVFAGGACFFAHKAKNAEAVIDLNDCTGDDLTI